MSWARTAGTFFVVATVVRACSDSGTGAPSSERGAFSGLGPGSTIELPGGSF